MRKSRWDILADLIIENGYKYIAEIGVEAGSLHRMMWPRINNLIEKFYLIDRYYKKELDDIKSKPKIKFIELHSIDAAKEFKDDSLDLVFIDANHDYNFVKEDINLWFPKVRKGGILCGHDYSNIYPGVIRAVNETFRDFELTIDGDKTDNLIAIWSVKK